MVYLMSELGSANEFKVGMTGRDAQVRVGELERNNGKSYKIVACWTVASRKITERVTHEHLWGLGMGLPPKTFPSGHKMEGGTEWFQSDSKDEIVKLATRVIKTVEESPRPIRSPNARRPTSCRPRFTYDPACDTDGEK